MSGECKSYRLNQPMKLQEFKAMPKDLQIAYIKLIREKWNPPVVAIAKMMGCDRPNLSKYLLSLGFEKQPRGAHPWDKMGFAEWCYGTPKQESQSVQEEVKEETLLETVEEVEQEVVEEEVLVANEEHTPIEYPIKEQIKKLCEEVIKDTADAYAIPETGSMTFTGNATQVMNTLVNLLGNAKVVLSVNWDVLEAEYD